MIREAADVMAEVSTCLYLLAQTRNGKPLFDDERQVPGV
jgi:hypothetical protein